MKFNLRLIYRNARMIRTSMMLAFAILVGTSGPYSHSMLCSRDFSVSGPGLLFIIVDYRVHVRAGY